MARMLYQGHGSYRFVLNDGTVIYVDPFAGEGYDLPADLIFVTHEHPDHTCTDLMPHAEGCLTFRAADFLVKGLHGTLGAYGVMATAVQAQNSYHPVDECVGLVIEMDGVSFYAAGDTSTTDDMRSGKLEAMGLDYAVFPCDGFYNMGPAEASQCARLVAARHSVPVHLVPVHDASNPTIFDRATAEAFQAPGRIILEPGEELELTPAN